MCEANGVKSAARFLIKSFFILWCVSEGDRLDFPVRAGSTPAFTAIITRCYYFLKKTVKSNLMKKLIFSLIAVATLSFAACNSNSTETKCEDSTVRDSICADSTCLTGDSTKTVDTTATIK